MGDIKFGAEFSSRLPDIAKSTDQDTEVLRIEKATVREDATGDKISKS